ncbi:FliM/FliN family flagellar motor C-terminal domain-containing protein [Spirochaeta isovalerica]|uniref:Flagellar motor switch/type III secretory pathway protein FliN n=1 Tax=Spirochaeta isovalerica TaxID=150 RepID=A0A841R739_9SPIO|nr:FliM/FliN family flagellar motor switch protein [Spirochaeta isovalerica]MBB6479653.1 flagellar motor switch/type III secretory pathway protein FliN [Spirochaeta isovalerica]
MRDFLKTSPIAGEVRLPANVVLHRKKMSAEELLSLESKGVFSVEERGDEEYELEVNGCSIAHGTIVKKQGGYFFKVKEMYGEEK